MNDLRKTTGPVRQALKAAVRRALTLAGGGDSVQYATRVKAPALCRYASSHEEHQEHHCPIDVALDLDLEAGRPVITEMLAKAQGYDLVPSKAVAFEDVPWDRKLSMGYRSTARVCAAIEDALADGKIEASEVPAILAEMDRDDAIKARLRARVEAEGAIGGQVVRTRGEAHNG